MRITTDQERDACEKMMYGMLTDGARFWVLSCQAMRDELSPEDQAEHDALMDEWAALNRALWEYDEMVAYNREYYESAARRRLLGGFGHTMCGRYNGITKEESIMQQYISMPTGESLVNAIDSAIATLSGGEPDAVNKALKLLRDAKQLAADASAKQAQLRDFVGLANDQYAEEGQIEIDDNALVSIFEGGDSKPAGAYVQAWVFVRTEPETE